MCSACWWASPLGLRRHWPAGRRRKGGQAGTRLGDGGVGGSPNKFFALIHCDGGLLFLTLSYSNDSCFLRLLTIFSIGCIWSDSSVFRVFLNPRQDPASDFASRAQLYSSVFIQNLLPLSLLSCRDLPKARHLFISSNTALRGLSFTASRRQSQELFFGSWIPSSSWFNFITAV